MSTLLRRLWRARRDTVGALVIASLALAMAAWNNDFPLGYHFDEPLKVRFAQSGGYDYHHPLLLIRFVQALNLTFGPFGDSDLAIVGRHISAWASAVTVLLVYAVGTRHLGHFGAAVAALLVALAPIVVVHAHYLKEDLLLLSTGMGTIVACAYWTKRCSWSAAALLGVVAGLALSSHYKALLLIATCVLVLLLSDRLRSRRQLSQLAVAGLIGVGVCVAVMPQLVTASSSVWSGFRFEHMLAIDGRAVPIPWRDVGFQYHLRHSLLPGLTPVTATVAIFALLIHCAALRCLSFEERLLVVYGCVSYIVPELSPSKPPPDDCRYVLPVVPALAYALASAATRLMSVFESHYGSIHSGLLSGAVGGFGRLAVVGLVAIPAIESWRLTAHMADDTRESASHWLSTNDARPEYGRLAAPDSRPEDRPYGFELSPSELLARGRTHLVLSSFEYDQFYFGATLSAPRPSTIRAVSIYNSLFQRPFVEFSPKHRTYAFSNPVIRVIDLEAQPRTDK